MIRIAVLAVAGVPGVAVALVFLRPVRDVEQVGSSRFFPSGGFRGFFRCVRRGFTVAADFLGAFQQGIGVERGGDLGLQLQSRELEQPDCLAQLRSQGDVLPDFELEDGLHRRSCGLHAETVA